MNTIRVFFVGFCLMALARNALGAELIAFEKIDEMIKAGNPVVDSMKDKAEAKKSREGQWGRSFLPDISAEVSQEAFKAGRESQKNQSAWKVEAGMNLFRGGADAAEEKVRKIETRTATEEFRLAVNEQVRKAYEMYWLLAYKQEVKNTLETHLSLSQKNLSEANRRIGSGVATATDRLEFQMKISLIKQEISVVDKDIRGLSKLLGAALGVSGEVLPKGPVQHFHDWEKNVEGVPPADVPEVRLAQREVEWVEAKKGQYGAEYFPVIDLYAGISEPNQREERDLASASERRESYVGIKASWSLGKAVTSSVERRSLQKEMGAKNKQLNHLMKQAEISQNSRMDELRTLHSFVHDLEENIKLSYSYLESTLKEYARGVKNSPDVLEATEKYFESRVRLAETVRDFNTLYSSQLALKAP